MHYTSSLSRLATNKCGMRRILKQKLSPVEYIKKAVQTGIYKEIYHPKDKNKAGRGRRGGGGNFNQFAPKIDEYPDEYEILTLNPPLPPKPRLSKKDVRFLMKEEQSDKKKSSERGSPSTDKYMKRYMERYDERMRTSSNLSDSEREDQYYQKIFGLDTPSTGYSGDSKLDEMGSAMGRKSTVLNHAYEFSLKQYEVLSENEGMTEEESLQVVEDILAKEEKDERLQSRMKAQKVVEDAESAAKAAEESNQFSSKTTNALSTATSTPPSFTIPSILYSKPRTIQALNIWGKRLQAVPYNQWTLGATTALDHWIAVDVLGMKEETWDRLLSGELEHDIQESIGKDLVIGDKARMNDILTVRSALFPETAIQSLLDQEEEEEELGMLGSEYGENIENALDSTEAEKDAAERSIDELLASLGGFDDDDEKEGKDDDGYKSDEISSAGDDDLDTRISNMVDSLQEWRLKNDETPYEEWDTKSKEKFDKWQSEYLSLVTNQNDGEVDVVATRDALLSEPAIDRVSSEDFWSQVQDEAAAEILLHNLLEKGSPQSQSQSKSKPLSDNPNENEKESAATQKSREALEAFLSLPYEKQLRQLVSLGTLRPILDEYVKESDRFKFMERHGKMLLEGIELEHLVIDPDGPIGIQDIGDDALLKMENVTSDTKFSIKMVPFDSDEFGMSRSEKARMLYRAWNIHKAGRARYAESQFKKGKMPLKV